MNRPLAKTKNDPPRSNNAKSGIGRACVMAKVITMAKPTKPAYTRTCPNSSANRPMRGVLKRLKMPPTR